MSDLDAEKIGMKDNDWVETVNHNGLVAARAIVSHRMPEGTVYMHHAQDRLIDVPLTERDGKRGGIHNRSPGSVQAEPHDRWVRPAGLLLQLHRADQATTATRSR